MIDCKKCGKPKRLEGVMYGDKPKHYCMCPNRKVVKQFWNGPIDPIISIVMDIINKTGIDEKNFKAWDKEHFLTQVKGDAAEPTRCPRCGGNNLNRTNKGKAWWKGWICKDCINVIDGLSFYQGRNNMRAEIIKELNNEKWI